jgi:sulfatase modifying factor 1
MVKQLLLLLPLIVFLSSGCTHKAPEKFVFVEGGTFINTKSNLFGKNAKIPDFYIGKYEVTQKEWTDVMGYNPSKFKGDSLPVEMVSWYDCVEYCNKRSLKEGFQPYYNIYKDKLDTSNTNEIDSIKWTVTYNTKSDGYRLPTEAEWEYAAGGGQKSMSYTYSGSNEIDKVAWYWRNSGDKYLTGDWHWPALENNHCQTKAVGSKKPNELRLFDMSGNVREWCEDWYEDFHTHIGFARVQRGGGWLGAGYCCKTSFRGSFEANGHGPDQGFRLCRSIINAKNRLH